MKIRSKIAIVTGASRGLGKATAVALIENGAVVYGIGRNKNDLTTLRDQFGENFMPVVLDITNQAEVGKWIAATFIKDRAPDILINNAGAGFFGKVDELPLEKWHQMVNTNLNAVFYMTSAIVPLMKAKSTFSHIINVGSILGKISAPEKGAYSATKFAMQGFSEALYKELRGNNIKVSCINPGSIDTHFFEESGIEPNENMLQPKDLAETLIYLLETPDNVLIDELSIRPLNPKRE